MMNAAVIMKSSNPSEPILLIILALLMIVRYFASPQDVQAVPYFLIYLSYMERTATNR